MDALPPLNSVSFRVVVYEKKFDHLTFTLIFEIAAFTFRMPYVGGGRGIGLLAAVFFYTGGVIVVS